MVKRKRVKQAGNLVSLWFMLFSYVLKQLVITKETFQVFIPDSLKVLLGFLFWPFGSLVHLVTKCLRKQSTNLVMEDEKSQNIFQVYITVYLKATVTLVDLIARVVIYAFQIKLNAWPQSCNSKSFFMTRWFKGVTILTETYSNNNLNVFQIIIERTLLW